MTFPSTPFPGADRPGTGRSAAQRRPLTSHYPSETVSQQTRKRSYGWKPHFRGLSRCRSCSCGAPAQRPTAWPGARPPVQAAPAGLSRAEPQLQRQELPGYVVVEDVQDSLEAEPVRHRSWPRRLLRPRRQQRFYQRPQIIVHDPRPGSHTLTNGRILTPVTVNQDVSARSCYEPKAWCRRG